MPNAKRGFVLASNLNQDYVRNMPVTLNSNQALAKGDPVTMVNGQIVPCTAGIDPALPGYGVVMAVYTTANRPLTHQTSQILASGAVGRADVYTDPNAVYSVRCESSAALARIGENVILAVSAYTPRLPDGSGFSVDIGASASIGNLFKLIGYAPDEELGGKETGAAAGQRVLVKWNRHLFRATGTADQ